MLSNSKMLSACRYTARLCVLFAAFFALTRGYACYAADTDNARTADTLILVGDIDDPPYSFRTEQSPRGYLIDLIKLLTPLTHQDVTIKLMSRENGLEELMFGRADGIIGSTVDEKLEKILVYSKPVCTLEYSVFTAAGSEEIGPLTSVDGLILAIPGKSLVLPELQKKGAMKLVKTETALEALYKLRRHEVSAAIVEKNTARYYIQHNRIRGLGIISPLVKTSYPFSIAVKKERADLLNAIDLGIETLEKNGELAELKTKWFGPYILEPFPWKKVFSMTAGITGVMMILFTLLLLVSLRATLQLKTHEMEILSRRIIEREKLAVLGHLAGQIAHELRTPLGIMKNSIYLLRREDPANRELFEKRFRLLEEKIKLSSDILESILDYSRIKAKKPAEVPVKECVDEVFKHTDIPGGITVEVSSSSDTPLMVYMDFHQLYTVLKNIVTNAVQAMPEIGKLAINMFETDRGDKVSIRICDTGVGIAESARNKIFNLFYSGKETGTGLGLPISKSIIEANNGELRLEETPETGTSFIITLPSLSSVKKRNIAIRTRRLPPSVDMYP